MRTLPGVGTLPGLTVALVAAALMPLSAARAQTTSTVSSLFLSAGSETDFGLYGASNTSDHLNVTNQFNYSSVGTYNVGFSLADNTPLTLGTSYSLISYGSTNFTDASAFRAIPSTGSGGNGGLSSISGTFSLVPANAGTGAPAYLQFLLTSYSATPEPSALLLLAPGALALLTTRKRRGA